jgi:hypothetical protein
MSTDEKWAQVSKGLGNVTEKARKIAREVCEDAWANGHDVYFLWGDGSTMDHMLNHTQKHPVIDYMVHNEAAGDHVRDYCWRNRARHGLRHVIWEQHITSTVVQPGVRRQMADRGDPTANHYDHVHQECFAGEYVAPDGSGVQGGSAPIDTSQPLSIDGGLGPKTIAKWQAVMGTTVDGVIDDSDSELIKAVQRRLQVTVDPSLPVDGALNAHTIRSLQRYLKSPVDGYISQPRSQVVMALQRRLNEGRF